MRRVLGFVVLGCAFGLYGAVGCGSPADPQSAGNESAAVGTAQQADHDGKGHKKKDPPPDPPADPPGCTHSTCNAGSALSTSCDSCTNLICTFEAPYCCSLTWDANCVNLASAFCGTSSCSCTHDLCTTGNPLDSGCSDCTARVCASDSHCCNTAWDSTCVEEAQFFCGQTCSTAECAHDTCTIGVALEPLCSDATGLEGTCVQSVCEQGDIFGRFKADPFCCSTSWDSQCVSEAGTICPGICPRRPPPPPH
jgi:hypothetical protein